MARSYSPEAGGGVSFGTVHVPASDPTPEPTQEAQPKAKRQKAKPKGADIGPTGGVSSPE